MSREQLLRDVADTLDGGLACRGFVDLVADYLEADLSFTGWVRFQLHLGICKGCRNYLGQMNETVRRLGALRMNPPSEEMRRKLQQRFRTWAGARFEQTIGASGDACL